MIKDYIKRRFDKWLHRRMPATSTITLHRGNLFILPSKVGTHFLITCFLLFLIGTNYQNNLILFLVFFLCSFMLTCLLLSYRNVAHLTLTAIANNNEAQFMGNDCPFYFRLSKPPKRGQGLRFAFQHQTSDIQSSLEGNKVIVYARADKRGYFHPGRIILDATFPFGLYRVWTYIDFDLAVLLYPSPIENNEAMHDLCESQGDKGSRHSLLGVDEFHALKNYQPGESLKSVAWKQLAQGRGWLSKQFEQSAGDDLHLDISLLNHLPLETRLSFLCYHIIELDKVQQRFSLTLSAQKIEVGSGHDHKLRCLKALALFNLIESEQ